MKIKYPYWRVIVYFTLCPAFVGIAIGIYMPIASYFYGISRGDNIFQIISLFLILPIVTGITGFVLFCIPAGGVSLIYVTLRLYRTWYSYLIVIFSGGIAAHLWKGIILGSSNNIYNPHEFLYKSTYYFIFGSFSSLIVAFFVLPKKESMESEHLIRRTSPLPKGVDGKSTAFKNK